MYKRNIYCSFQGNEDEIIVYFQCMNKGFDVLEATDTPESYLRNCLVVVDRSSNKDVNNSSRF